MKAKIKEILEQLKGLALVVCDKAKELLIASKSKFTDFDYKELLTYNGLKNFIVQWWHRILIVLAVFVLLYYPVGGVMVNDIDDDVNYVMPENVISGGSMTVAAVASLIDREVNQKTWTANLPFMFPSYFLDNMPNFQMGIISSLSRFTTELAEQIARTRGASQVDEDLEKASGLLKYSGKIWFIDSSTSFMPTASSNKQYRAARRKLLSYNKRLAKGEAVFEVRADNLIIVLDRISKDLGSMSAEIDKKIENDSSKFIDFKSDDVFYNIKGKIYGYAIILRYLGDDFREIIKEKNLDNLWFDMIDSINKAALFDARIVVNGKLESVFLNSHLSVQGFYLLRARTKLQEITKVISQ